MIGILIELLASWLVLWIYNRKNLTVLGFGLSKKRFYNFSFGLFISSLCYLIYFLATIQLSNSRLIINDNYNTTRFFQSSYWTLKSVLFEELIFRGALLYIAIEKLGTRSACIISAIAFGVYHWFSYGVWGQPLQMLFVFIITAIAGLMFAYAFAKTRSLYLPIGLHLGWNLMTIVVFSQGPLKDQLFISNGGEKPGDVISVLLLLFQILALPVIVFWYLRRQTARTH
ncbi:MAG: CPBP family intramembrane metalloprotease [Chitinophagales bacterium]|nr:CPBP family intramembrane metalloprotease [Chitinophagales bacterium]